MAKNYGGNTVTAFTVSTNKPARPTRGKQKSAKPPAAPKDKGKMKKYKGKSLMRDVGTYVKNYALTKGTEYAAKELWRLANEMAGDKSITLPDGTKISVIDAVKVGLGQTTGDESKQPAQEKQSQRLLTPEVGAKVQSKVYNVRYKSGQKTAKAINQYISLHGERDITFLNSYKEFTTGFNGRRDLLRPYGGFNQKIWFMSEDLQTDLNDIFSGGGSLLNEPTTGAGTFSYWDKMRNQFIYAMTKRLKEQLHFVNLNAYNSINVKIHLIATKKPLTAISSKSEAYMRPLDVLALTPAGESYLQRIPQHMILKGAQNFKPYYTDTSVLTGGAFNMNRAYAAWVDPTASIYGSPEFNTNYKVIKTFSKRLGPGDILEFENMIELGSGLPIHEMWFPYKRTKEATEWDVGEGSSIVTTPIAYHYLIEIVGQKVVGVANTGGLEYNTVNNERFIGTAPFQVQMEVIRKMDVACVDRTINNLTADGFDMNQNTIPLRVYTKNEMDSPGVIFHKDYGDGNVIIPNISPNILQVTNVIDNTPDSTT